MPNQRLNATLSATPVTISFGGGAASYTFTAADTGNGIGAAVATGGSANASSFLGSLSDLSSGSDIDGNQLYGFSAFSAPAIIPDSAADDFIGLSFTLADGVHYGYAEVAGPTLVSFGYDATPGTTIQAGATTSDGSGGTFIALTGDTIGVYRFFDSNHGTHFFSASPSERNTIIDTRPDLVYEGVGLQSVDPASNDPNSSPVYRFFDSTYGTHFFTASASERDTVIGTRPDLVYEGTGFYEHTQQQAGDTAVYRFFDTRFGNHFYTADAGERATVAATRPDLVDEGIGFYAPAQP